MKQVLENARIRTAEPERTMRILKQAHGLDPQDQGASIAIGNFDGVHLGHRSVIDLARQAARRLGAPLGVLTFEPHPRAFFAAEAPPFRLTGSATRSERLARLGVECLYELTFNKALAALSPEGFARAILHDGLRVRHVVVGANFRFGKNRAGNVDMLAALGRKLHFGVTAAPLVNDPQSRVSSTSIRAALSEGQARLATRRLGEPHRLNGRLKHLGQQDFTLSLSEAGRSLTEVMLPRPGIYAIRVDSAAGSARGLGYVAARSSRQADLPGIALTIFGAGAGMDSSEVSVALLDYHGSDM